MAQKAIPGSPELAAQIKSRRTALGLTIEEAALRAGVGTKTWCRYEAGESIRQDKCKGICKALNWIALPSQDADAVTTTLQDYKKHEAWSQYLEEVFGPGAAFSFAVGSDILLDDIEEDISSLAAMPAGSHLGQLNVSLVMDELPAQFLTHYDYDFLYHMKCTLIQMRAQAGFGHSIIAHTVSEELLLYLCCREASTMTELSGDIFDIDECTDWVFDLLDDMDIITFLYSDLYINADNPYHFSHWFEPQFYLDDKDS